MGLSYLEKINKRIEIATQIVLKELSNGNENYYLLSKAEDRESLARDSVYLASAIIDVAEEGMI